MTTIEVVAEAIRAEWVRTGAMGSELVDEDATARAAVSALAGMGDITDHDLTLAYLDCVDGGTDGGVRALLARQAAVHATRLIECEAAEFAKGVARGTEYREAAERRAEAAEARVAELSDIAHESSVARAERVASMGDAWQARAALSPKEKDA